MTDETPNNPTKQAATKRLSPAGAARIRATATHPDDAATAAREALWATARYMRKHRKGSRPDDPENTAAARIFWQYEGLVELIQAGASAVDVATALGIYIARLELLVAQLEAELKTPTK